MERSPTAIETGDTMGVVTTIRKPPKPSFKSEAGAVLERLQKALAEVIALIPGEVDKAADLERELKIRKTLAWQVYRMATAPDPVLEASNLPGQFAMERFLDAARVKGVPQAKLDAASKALTDYRRFVKTHAGDRKTFDSLMSGVAPQNVQIANLTSRRAAFRANSDIWGLQVRTRFSVLLYYPGDDRMIDHANIRGIVDLQQLRENRPFILSRTHVEQARSSRLDHPIDLEAHERYGVSLLSEFCTDPDTHVRTYTDANNELVAELVPSTVGKAGAASAVVASCFRGWGFRFRTPETPDVCGVARTETPFETYVGDVLIAEGAYGKTLPALRASVVGRAIGGGDELMDGLAKHLLWREDVKYLGRGPSVLATPDVPRYPEMVEHVCSRLGWDPERLHVFRCRVEYPPMPSSIVVQFDLPEKP